MEKFLATWAKRAAIAFALLVAVPMTVVGIPLALDTQTPLTLPAVPGAPARVLPGIALAVTPPAEAPPAESTLPELSQAVAATGDFLVAVGLFASRERADELVDVLTQAGLPAMQRPFRFRGRDMQQIVLGPFFSRSDAVADLGRLQSLGGHADANVIDSAQ